MHNDETEIQEDDFPTEYYAGKWVKAKVFDIMAIPIIFGPPLFLFFNKISTLWMLGSFVAFGILGAKGIRLAQLFRAARRTVRLGGIKNISTLRKPISEAKSK